MEIVLAGRGSFRIRVYWCTRHFDLDMVECVPRAKGYTHSIYLDGSMVYRIHVVGTTYSPPDQRLAVFIYKCSS